MAKRYDRTKWVLRPQPADLIEFQARMEANGVRVRLSAPPGHPIWDKPRLPPLSSWPRWLRWLDWRSRAEWRRYHADMTEWRTEYELWEAEQEAVNEGEG